MGAMIYKFFLKFEKNVAIYPMRQIGDSVILKSYENFYSKPVKIAKIQAAGCCFE